MGDSKILHQKIRRFEANIVKIPIVFCHELVPKSDGTNRFYCLQPSFRCSCLRDLPVEIYGWMADSPRFLFVRRYLKQYPCHAVRPEFIPTIFPPDTACLIKYNFYWIFSLKRFNTFFTFTDSGRLIMDHMDFSCKMISAFANPLSMYILMFLSGVSIAYILLIRYPQFERMFGSSSIQ